MSRESTVGVASPESSTSVGSPQAATATPAPTAVVATPPEAAEPQSVSSPQTVPAATVRFCANCGAAVTNRYCASCGQRYAHSVHSVWHFICEATEDLTHADSRLWRTIVALLFRPGHLTREFLAGRRARYLPPLRLYIVVSVLFFLVLGSIHRDPRVVQLRTGAGASNVTLESAAASRNLMAARPGETDQQHAERVCNPNYQGPAQRFVEPFLKKGCRSVIEDNGRTVKEAFLHNAARAMFLFLPVFALIMMMLYWHPRRYYVEHLLFCVHAHAFAFLVLATLSVASLVLPEWLDSLVSLIAWLYVFYYVSAAMRRVYGQNRLWTGLKLTVLSFAYFFGVLMMLALTGVYRVWSL